MSLALIRALFLCFLSGYSMADCTELVQQPATGWFWAQHGAAINRVNDRLFIGGATTNDATWPNLSRDWLTDYQVSIGLPSGLILSTQSATLTGNDQSAGAAIVGAARTRHFTSPGTSALGVTGMAINDNATLGTNAWGGYFEGHHTAGNATYAVELDTRTTRETVNPTPYAQGNVVGLQIASGAGVSAAGQYDASAAIQIEANPRRFKAGIVFGASSLAGNVALMLAENHTLAEWYSPTGKTAVLSSGGLNVDSLYGYSVAGTNVLGPRQTGWTAGTGTPNKRAFNTATATTAQIAQRLLAIEQMLRAHGLMN